MPTHPTRISYTKTTDFTSNGSPKTIASISWQTGDVIVVGALAEGSSSETLGTPTVSGLTFTIQKSTSGASHCASMIATAVAASNGSGVISVTNSNSGASHWGFGASVWRGSDGPGNSVEQHTTARTAPLTPTAADSAIVWLVGDWNADAAQSGSPAPTNTNESTQDSGKYTAHAFDLTDQTSGSQISYGIGGSGAGPFSIVGQEVKGAGSAALTVKPVIRSQAVNRAASY